MIRQELTYFISGIKNVKFKGVSKKKIVFDLISNTVAAIIASLVYWLLQLFFKVETPLDKLGSILGIGRKKKRILLDESTFDFLSWLLIFIIGLVVFTYVEQVMERYFEEREKGFKK